MSGPFADTSVDAYLSILADDGRMCFGWLFPCRCLVQGGSGDMRQFQGRDSIRLSSAVVRGGGFLFFFFFFFFFFFLGSCLNFGDRSTRRPPSLLLLQTVPFRCFRNGARGTRGIAPDLRVSARRRGGDQEEEPAEARRRERGGNCGQRRQHSPGGSGKCPCLIEVFG